ncbi:DEAD/DEAH box helicase family protein (plasmid) [Rhodococcus sp. LW-XY12]|nr:DEAD/DEAH box helicase family protein [Rhodococcus sp. LW-XY12]
MAISTVNIWADPRPFGRNRVRQLLVPACDELGTRGDEHGTEVHGPYGCWPAVYEKRLAVSGPLTAVLSSEDSSSLRWQGSRQMSSPEDVLTSYRGAIGFRPPEDPGSLRRPQIGALHSILGYLSSGLTEPAVIVMPTGTGKTETMLAWMVAGRPQRLLVVVPSAALRAQIADKFETLGILQRAGVVARSAMRPCVGRLEHGFQKPEDAASFVQACNVIVATPHALQACDQEARHVLLAACTHLVVDEAHHAPADTWTEVIRAFAERPVLLFTATPFRSDGRALPGKTIFRFPLREAQKEGYFSPIEFTAIFAVDDADEELAAAAIGRLRQDLAEGYDHVLLVRAGSRQRAGEIHAIYIREASEYQPRLLHDGLGAGEKSETLDALRTGQCRIVVCVDMLGEGFDMPTLKVAAFHDTRKSLSPMIQLVGRLARTSSPTEIGTASIFVSQDPSTARSPLRDLLREDPDWNQVLSDVTDRATARAEEISEFDASFAGTPSSVPIGLLEPKMSAIVFRTGASDWEPDAAQRVNGASILDGAISISAHHDVAWFVTESVDDLRWGSVPGLRDVGYDLTVLYFDRTRGLLFVHGSDTRKKYDKLAEAVLGTEPIQVRGIETFRVFSKLDRLIPTNVGLLDVRDRDKRFSMHVGSDVEAALTEAERNHKTNTHISASAFDNGVRVTISAALSGRFWSMQTASGLMQWREWCDRQGTKLIDTSVDIRTVFRDMIIPTPVTERPPFPLLSMEWPWDLYLGTGTSQHARYVGTTSLLTDVDFEVDDHSEVGDFLFSVFTPDWKVPYAATIGSAGVRYRALGSEVTVENSRGDKTPLSTWLNAHKPTLFLSGDRLITGDDRLLVPRTDVPPFDRGKLMVLDWSGVDIRVESQGVDRRSDSIQAYMVRYLTGQQTFDVLIDDDGAGEAADLVGLRIEGDDLRVTLVHCKYSSSDLPGKRLQDLYEVCGQAIRGARWRDRAAAPLLEHLDRRVQAYAKRTGKSAFEVGDRKELNRIRERAPLLFPRLETIIVQPGLSAKVSSDEQLRLIAGAESYVRAVTKGKFAVYCSA